MKLTFAKGAALEDPSRLFNASLEGNTRRAIDLHEGDTLEEDAFKALIRAAVTRNIAQPQSAGEPPQPDCRLSPAARALEKKNLTFVELSPMFRSSRPPEGRAREAS